MPKHVVKFITYEEYILCMSSWFYRLIIIRCAVYTILKKLQFVYTALAGPSGRAV